MFSFLSEWWNNLQGFELILWCIALFFSALFIIQTILSFIGSPGLDDADFSIDHHDGAGYQFFTIKNMIAFFTMFGWSGLAAYKAGLDNSLVAIIALISGSSLVLVMYLLMHNAGKLRHSGTLQIKNAINQIGETYLRIPGKRMGIGKVQVQVQGRLMELDAMTDDIEDISTGRPIQVTSILNNHILLVTSASTFDATFDKNLSRLLLISSMSIMATTKRIWPK